MTNKTTDKFARQLIDCLQRFGAMQSNPVLHLLEKQAPVANSRYPEEAIGFGDDTWRVFYHCHDSTDQPSDEHGHFHFFTRSRSADDDVTAWSHLVALSMDKMGQPLQWFMVNQWVTDGDWYRNEWLDSSFQQLARAHENGLLEQWCQSLLYLYKEEIAYLLRQRDKNLAFLCNSDNLGACFQDRDIYLLSIETVSLVEKLQQQLDTDIKTQDRNGDVA